MYPTSYPTVTDETFLAEVMAQTPGGEKLRTCLQCGTCGGLCPSAPEMDHSPRTLFALIASGERQTVLRSNAPWYCVSCYYCMVPAEQGAFFAKLLNVEVSIISVNDSRQYMLSKLLEEKIEKENSQQ